jgi:hypothetical protein
VPRRNAGDNDKPRRRRGANAMALEAATERGLMMRILLHSPKDTVAGALAFAALVAIIVNALFLQAGHHPAPMFGSVVMLPEAPPVSPLPRPRPLEASVRPAEVAPPESKPAEPRIADPLTNLVKATSEAPVAASNVPRPPAAVPVAPHNEALVNMGSRRVAAVQRALTEYGYGQLKPTGTVNADTLAAIQKFERERRIPMSGQVSERLVHELSAMIGHPID